MRISPQKLIDKFDANGNPIYDVNRFSSTINLIFKHYNAISHGNTNMAIRRSDTSIVKGLSAMIVQHHNIIKPLILLQKKSESNTSNQRFFNTLLDLLSAISNEYKGLTTDQLLTNLIKEQNDNNPHGSLAQLVIECIISIKFAFRAFSWLDDKDYIILQKKIDAQNSTHGI